jgi:hypothetical protein
LSAVVSRALGDVEPVQVGQHHVQHDQVGPVLLDGLESGASAGDALHLETVHGQAQGEQFGYVLFVVGYEHAGSPLGHVAPPGPILGGPPATPGGPAQLSAAAEATWREN